MRIESKFLTADVRLTAARLEGRTLVTEGLLKEFMPVRMEMEPEDVKLMGRLLLSSVGKRVDEALPAPLRHMLTVARGLLHGVRRGAGAGGRAGTDKRDPTTEAQP